MTQGDLINTICMEDNRVPIKDRCRLLAESIWKHYCLNGEIDWNQLDALITLAVDPDRADWNQPAAHALFATLIEGLCDSFADGHEQVYIEIMGRMIQTTRRFRGFEPFDRQLSRFGLNDLQCIVERARHVYANSWEIAPFPPNIRKVVFLSRVTIGADVAVAGVLISHIAEHYPDAELVVVGNEKLKDVFGGDNRIKVAPLQYVRRGGLGGKLLSWLALLETLEHLTHDIDPSKVLVIDPDSRLLQLGLLPLEPAMNYRFFNSRIWDEETAGLKVAELASYWIRKQINAPAQHYPFASPERGGLDKVNHIREALESAGCRRLVVVNLGVGGNESKRIPGAFEGKLLRLLLEAPDTVVVLDRGFGEEEETRTGALLRLMEKVGVEVVEPKFEDSGAFALRHGMAGVYCGIGEIAALIAASDLYVGYDSAGQHLAAASNVPLMTIFAGSDNPRFIQRWTPTARTASIFQYSISGAASDTDGASVLAWLRECLPASKV